MIVLVVKLVDAPHQVVKVPSFEGFAFWGHVDATFQGWADHGLTVLRIREAV